MIQFVEVRSDKDYQIALVLFREYASQIGVDLSFQNFNQELLDIDIQYSKPQGVLYIAYDSKNQPVGCFGVRALEASICELKRMYLKKAYRGLGLGGQLLVKAINVGRELGYEKMRLDTLPTMQTAIRLYQKTGFYEIEAYCFNPIEGTKYFEIALKNSLPYIF